MRANFPARRRRAADQAPIQRNDDGEARLWHLRTALAVSFTVAVVGLAGLALLAWVLLGWAGYRHHGAPALHDTVAVLQLVFATVAGAGALVALIVAYRRQKITEADSLHDRTRVFNERFTAIASQLGDAQPAVRLAGVHAMAGLADDWKQNRQTCVDVLCAYLRLPYDPDPGSDADPAQWAAYRANREVRHTIIRLIGAHLRPEAAVSWQGLNLDFTGVVFDGGDFTEARFPSGIVLFDGAEFAGGQVSFLQAEFSGAQVSFTDAKFSGGHVNFNCAEFSGSEVSFFQAEFSGGEVSFNSAEFAGGEVDFSDAWFSGAQVVFGAEFSGGQVNFLQAEFSDGRIYFGGAKFSDGLVYFGHAKFSGSEVVFGAKFPDGQVVISTRFSGGEVDFSQAEFSDGLVYFGCAEFADGEVDFSHAKFSGSEVDFRLAKFSGAEVSFGDPELWSHPPMFPWDGEPPTGVLLPDRRGVSAPSEPPSTA